MHGLLQCYSIAVNHQILPKLPACRAQAGVTIVSEGRLFDRARKLKVFAAGCSLIIGMQLLSKQKFRIKI
jgi:hypothetical protein